VASGRRGSVITQDVLNGPSHDVLRIACYFPITGGTNERLVGWPWRRDVELLAAGAGLHAAAAAERAIGVELLVRLAVRALGGASTGWHAIKFRRGRRQRSARFLLLE